MKARRLSIRFSIFTAVVVVALSGSAFADGAGTSLPATLGDWREEREEIALPETSIISLTELPQGRLSQPHPFIDFSHWEFGAFAGVADYSADFKANANWVVGIDTRVPIPGLPLGGWGAWAEAFVGNISRNIPFYYKKPSGTWYGVAGGGDYTLYKGEILAFRAQAGALYADWNNINALKNGVGVIVGADFAFFWIKHNDRATVTFNPQFTYDSKNWIGLYTLGFSYDF
jgi:hypothetical protein